MSAALRDTVARALESAAYDEWPDAALDAIFAPEHRAALVAELLERGVIEQPTSSVGWVPVVNEWNGTVQYNNPREYTVGAVPLYRVLGEPS